MCFCDRNLLITIATDLFLYSLTHSPSPDAHRQLVYITVIQLQITYRASHVTKPETGARLILKLDGRRSCGNESRAVHCRVLAWPVVAPY